MMDSHILKAGNRFEKLPESYVIFITEKGYYRRGFPVYTVNRVIEETGNLFADGSHIIYVNGSYVGSDAVGRLMHDFRQKNTRQMYNKELIESVLHFKGDKEENMSSAIDDFAKKVAERAAKYEQEKARLIIEEAERKANEAKKEVKEAKKAANEASMVSAIKTAIAYDIEKERIIPRLCSEFKLSEEEANKAYEKYATKTA